MTLREWVISVGGREARLLELRNAQNHVVALVNTSEGRRIIKIPDEILFTYEEQDMIGRGPISKIKKLPKTLDKPCPYYPLIKWYD
jgi:hypothetical protein